MMSFTELEVKSVSQPHKKRTKQRHAMSAGRPQFNQERMYFPHFKFCKVVHDTRCYFNVRSKADISQLNLPHGAETLVRLGDKLYHFQWPTF